MCLYFTAPVWEKQRWRRPGEIQEAFMRHSLVPPQALGPYSSPGLQIYPRVTPSCHSGFSSRHLCREALPHSALDLLPNTRRCVELSYFFVSGLLLSAHWSVSSKRTGWASTLDDGWH